MRKGFILVLLCLWYSIDSYTIQAQPYEQGKWRILPIEYGDPHFDISRKDIPGMIRGTKTKCNMAPGDPFGYSSIIGNCVFPGGNKDISGISLEDVNQCYWVRARTVHNCNILHKKMSINFTHISPMSNDNRLSKIDFTITKRVLWNYWEACDGNKKIVERSFTETRDYTNAYHPSEFPIVMATSNQPMIEKKGISTEAGSIDGDEIFNLYARYDFGDDMKYYIWEYNLDNADANSNMWKPLNRTAKCITGTMAQLMDPVERVQNYSYKTIYFRLKKTATTSITIYDDNPAGSIVYHPKPIAIEIQDSRVTCKGDMNARFSVTLKEDLPKGHNLLFEIATDYGPGTIANAEIKGSQPAGASFTFNLHSAKLPAGTYIIKYNQYSIALRETSSLETRTFVIAEPDSTNFPRTIFANDYLLCAGTSGQTFIDTKEAWSSGNGAPYHFWMYKEGAIDTVKRILSNNTKYTFDGLISGKYTYGGTDWLGCPSTVHSFEMKEPVIPSYKILTQDSLGEYKTGAAKCYGLDDSVKNIYVYNPRATVAYYQMNTTQPNRIGEWWTTFYKDGGSTSINKDTFINPVFNLYGKLRDTNIIQLREWHIDKGSGLTFTCPVYKRDERDSLILKDSTRLILDTVLFINQGVDIVGDTALMIKKDSVYFTIDTMLKADSGLYISAKKDTLYRDKDRVLYENDSLYIVQDTVFLNLYKTWTLSDSIFKVKDTLFVNRTNLLYTGDSFYIYYDTVFLKRDSLIIHKPNLYIWEDTLLMKKDSLVCVDAKVYISNDTGYINKDSILLIDENVYINEDTVWKTVDSLVYTGAMINVYSNRIDTSFVVKNSTDSISVGKYFMVLPKDSILDQDSIVYTGNSMYVVDGKDVYFGDIIYKILDTGYLKQDTMITLDDAMYLDNNKFLFRKDSILWIAGDTLYMERDTLYVRKVDSMLFVSPNLYIVGDSLLLSQDSTIFVDSKLLLRGDSAFAKRDSSLFAGRYLYNRGDSIYWERNEHLYVSNKLYMLNDSIVKDKDSIILIKPNLYKKGDSIILDSNVYHYRGDSIYRDVDSFVVLKKQIAYIPGDSISRKADSLYVKADSVYVLKRDTVSYFEWKDTLQIWQPSPLEVSLKYLKDVRCYNDSNGQILIQVLGGTTFLQDGQHTYKYRRDYTYSNFYVDSVRGFIDSILTAKQHKFYIEDAHLCRTEDTMMVYQPTKLEIDSIRGIQPECFDARTGEISIYPKGGAVRHPLQYSVLWSPLDGEEKEEKFVIHDSLSQYRLKNIRSRVYERVLDGVDYTITVSDTNRCKIVGMMRINNPATLRIKNKEITSACAGESNGRVEYVLNNTKGIFNINFTNIPAKSVSGTGTIKGLAEGIYPVVISDGSGKCNILDTVNIPSLSMRSVPIDQERYLCLGQSVDYDISQPGENITYEWRSDKGFFSSNPKVKLNVADRYYATTTNYGTPTCSRTDTLNLISFSEHISNEITLDPRGNLRAWTLAVNTSYPPADSIRWVLPEAAEGEAGNINRQYLYFKDTGIYTVGLYTYRGKCWSYGERSIRVVNMSDMDPTQIPLDRKGIADFLAFPNPNTGGNFTIWVDLFDIDDVEIWLTNPMAKIAQGSGQKYYRFTINQPLATGAYTLVVRTRHGDKSFNIIVW